MEVILVKDVDKFGKTGSVIKVKPGFARNFLFPRSLAVPATPANLRKIEQEAKRVEGQKLREEKKAQDLSNRLSGMSITIATQTHDEDKLYGSIGAAEIIAALKEEGISEIAAEAVVLDEPIKSTGVYEITIRLHPNVETGIKVWIVRK